VISIISITQNNLEGLKKTIKSTLSQNFDDFELIVIDGASTDGSKIFLQSISDPRFHSISEPDTGIYNAFNKGVAQSSGDWIIFMNAGDEFANRQSLGIFAKAANSRYKLVYSDLFIDQKERHQPPIFKLGIFRNPCHQSVLFNSRLFQEFKFNEAFAISADADLIHQERAIQIKANLKNPFFKFLNLLNLKRQKAKAS